MLSDEEKAQYELFREQRRITEWRDGAVYRTVSEGFHWVDMLTVENNKPMETNITYSSPPTSFKGMAIRRKAI
jgi:hypothetical protein